MGNYSVEIPITGQINIMVKAKDKRAALKRAWKLYDAGWEKAGFDVTWEALEKVSEGNVLHAMLNEQCATKVGT